MANRRDLHVGIDADDRGFGAAFEDAADKAQGLDRELGKLERQQALTEKSTNRAADAARKFGVEQEKAGLQARKMGAQVQQASERAEKAQKRADAAAKAYERGLIDEATAARAAANAAKAVEQADIRAAEAQLAAREAAERVARAQREAARAAEEQAQQERQLARDAALAAAAQRLGQLKAAGAVKEHNALLGHLQATYGDLSKEASGAFKAIESSGNTAYRTLTSASAQLGEMGPLAIVGIANAIVALPTIAAAAGAALTLGMGGAFAAIGLMAQASSKDVKAAFSDLQKHVTKELTNISAPFHDTLLHMAADGRRAFDSLTPALASAFAQMAPAVTRFTGHFADALANLDPMIRSLGQAFSSVLDTIGPRLPTVLNNVSTGFKAIFDAVQKNPKALADFVVGISNFVRYSGDAIGFLIRFKNEFDGFFRVFAGGGPLGFLHFVNGIGTLISTVGRFVGIGGKGSQTAREFGSAAGFASSPTSALAKDMKTLESSTASAADKVSALTDRFERLLNPQEAVFTDTAHLKDSFKDLTSALKKSHGALTDHSKASRDAKDAFAGVIDNAKTFASDLLNSGDSLETVQGKLKPYIESMYKAAGSNKDARKLVDAFVTSLNLVPPKKGTKVSAPGAKDAKDQIKGVSDAAKKTDKYKNLKFTLHAADKATGVARKAVGKLKDFADGTYRATLRAKSAVSNAVSDATSACKRFARGTYQAALRAKNYVTSAFNDAMALGRRWASQTFKATFGVIKKLFSAEGGYVDGTPGYAGGGAVRRFPTGGHVAGPGSATSDSIPAMLSNGEYVINAAATAAWRPLLDAINYGNRVPVQAAPVLSGASGGSSMPAQVTQNNVFQSQDPHVVARESARELAWMLRG